MTFLPEPHQLLLLVQLMLRFIPISHCTLLVLSTASNVHTELMNVSFGGTTNIYVFMCRSPSGEVTHQIVLISPVGRGMSCSSYSDGLWDGSLESIQLLFLCVASWICSKQHAVFLCSSHLAFFSRRFISTSGASIQLYWYGYSSEEFPFYFVSGFLSHWWDNGVQIYPKGIHPKETVIAWLEFELTMIWQSSTLTTTLHSSDRISI